MANTKHIKPEFRVYYDFGKSWDEGITLIEIQKKIRAWPDEWETIKSEPYLGEDQANKFEAEVSKLNAKIIKQTKRKGKDIY